ncbi:MAG TPA: hypothetical protein VE974_08390 [Thermoanaerobaculia bacterium]|nr:hypothetical protein [Thermoanaerobaculia bacterium]
MARSDRAPSIVIAGGDADPNLESLGNQLERLGIPFLPMLVGASSHPRFHWNLENDELRFDGKRISPAALFIRYDVFTNLSDGGRPESAGRANAWYTAVASWAAAHDEVRLLNRQHSSHLLKPQQLMAARACGLAIPKTLVTNDLDQLARLNVAKSVVKPVAGGDYCRELADVLPSTDERGRAAASPAIVQERLEPPELRIYRVGRTFLSFDVSSDALDYRTSNNTAVTFRKNEQTLIAPLRKLMNVLRLDFGAADFKTCPKTGRFLFLEVNSSPMFAAFDAASDGAVSRAIAHYLRS